MTNKIGRGEYVFDTQTATQGFRIVEPGRCVGNRITPTLTTKSFYNYASSRKAQLKPGVLLCVNAFSVKKKSSMANTL